MDVGMMLLVLNNPAAVILTGAICMSPMEFFQSNSADSGVQIRIILFPRADFAHRSKCRRHEWQPPMRSVPVATERNQPASTSIPFRISSAGLDAASGRGGGESHLPVGDGLSVNGMYDICGYLSSHCGGKVILVAKTGT